MNRFASLTIAVSLLLGAGPAQAQGPIVSPTIGGIPVNCPVGQVFVPTIFTPQIPGGDVAFSTFINGQPVILLHP